MLNFDNKPQIYLCLQLNGDTHGVEKKIGIIYVSLSSKARIYICKSLSKAIE
jgi:hypothetical protein